MAVDHPSRVHPPVEAGNVYGLLTAIRVAEPVGIGQQRWVCRCECGNEKIVRSLNLKRGLSKSCGCVAAAKNAVRLTKHGLASTPEFAHWDNMIGRCHRNKKSKYYKNGIRVCERWRNSPEAFIADMGPKPTPDHSVERIDNEKNYTCGKCEECQREGATLNCRWATFTEQMRNTSRSHFVTYQGRQVTIVELAELAGLPYHIVFERLKRGRTPEQAADPLYDARKSHSG